MTLSKTEINTEVLHTLAALVHLPYDHKKLEGLIHFKEGSATGIRGATGAGAESTYFSFDDKNGHTKYYKKIAEVDENPGKDASDGHNAVAFVEIDKNGNKIFENGKATVFAVFPGMNNKFGGIDLGEAGYDYLNKTSFSSAFYNKFESVYNKALHDNGLNSSNMNVEAIGHSMGDKHALQFALNHHDAKVMILDGWDTKDALVGAAIRKTMENSYGSEADFDKALEDNLYTLKTTVIDVRKDLANNSVDHSYIVINAGHTAKNYLNVGNDRLLSTQKNQDFKELLHYAHANLKDFVVEGIEMNFRFFSKEDKQEMDKIVASINKAKSELDIGSIPNFHHYFSPQFKTDKGNPPSL